MTKHGEDRCGVLNELCPVLSSPRSLGDLNTWSPVDSTIWETKEVGMEVVCHWGRVFKSLKKKFQSAFAIFKK